MGTVHRSCPTCEASCGLVLEIDDATHNIVSIKGDELDHRSKGYVCAKSQAFRYVYEDPERLRKPLKKVDGQWQEISWQQALDEISGKLGAIRNEHGKDAIAMYYGNPNGHNFSTMVYTELFTQMLSTERFFSAGAVDQQPKNLSSELLYGNAWVFPIPDIQRSDYYVCMGGNPLVSQGSLMSAPDAERQLNNIRERGGKVVVIDPRRDIDIYLDIAQENECDITHIIETHRNEDLISGAPILSELVDAEVLHGPNADGEVLYATTVKEGHQVRIGNLTLEVIETPGHTKDSICILVFDNDFDQGPVGIFTGIPFS